MSVAAGFLVVAGALALLDWWAVGMGRRDIEIVAKPATMAALVGVAATFGSVPGDVRTWLVVGAVLGLVGDIALLGDGETEFLTGLGAFAIGHLAYGLAALSVGFDARWGLAGAVAVVALLSYRFATRTLPGARETGGSTLAGAVVVYAVVISFMVVTSWATGSWLAAAGALLFAVSDWVLGHRRFVGELPVGRLGVMIPYHIGQAALIVGLATA